MKTDVYYSLFKVGKPYHDNYVAFKVGSTTAEPYVFPYRDGDYHLLPKMIVAFLKFPPSSPCRLTKMFMRADYAQKAGHYMTHRLTIYSCDDGELMLHYEEPKYDT